MEQQKQLARSAGVADLADSTYMVIMIERSSLVVGSYPDRVGDIELARIPTITLSYNIVVAHQCPTQGPCSASPRFRSPKPASSVRPACISCHGCFAHEHQSDISLWILRCVWRH
jgi:hypothetical protein